MVPGVALGTTTINDTADAEFAAIDADLELLALSAELPVGQDDEHESCSDEEAAVGQLSCFQPPSCNPISSQPESIVDSPRAAVEQAYLF